MPTNLLPATRRMWREVWDSPASNRVGSHHLPAIGRLFRLRDQFERAAAVMDAAMMVKGSLNQIRVNPAADYMTKLAAAIDRLENELGLTPMSEARLGLVVGQAEMTLEELNAAVSRNLAADEDPRLALLPQQETVSEARGMILE
jgi:P27 family predicted phage terminase small subunit